MIERLIKSTHYKIAAIYIVMILVTTTALGLFSYMLFRGDSIKAHGHNVLSIAKAVAPAIDPDDLVTALSTGEKSARWNETKTYLNMVKEATSDIRYVYVLDSNYDTNLTYYIEGQRVNDITEDISDLLLKDSVGAYPEELFTAIQTGQPIASGLYDSGDYGYLVSGFMPITDKNGKIVGVVGVDISAEDTLAAAGRFMRYIVLIVILAIVLSTLIIIPIIKNNIGIPLTGLFQFMTKASSTGDLSINTRDMEIIKKFSQSKDEIGQTIAFSTAFVNRIRNISNILEQIAKNDLTAELSLLSKEDTMGLSLNKMLTQLNTMLGEIHASTDQVAQGAEQISTGAQTLAQGAADQASSIENLSDSIVKIKDRTEMNAATAEKTAKLSDTIKENAEIGNSQMGEMMTAVGQITDASRNISHINNTINEIAFQTNILALNAAVEAARAGEHGKGFAVVAAEVRNLAAKSAEAAKDTDTMIQDSIEKAEIGSRIAAETATSLTEIVTGIKEITDLLEEIVRSSEEQASGIAMINSDIEQLEQVVQQNNATAEGSADASVEMSDQATKLKQLLAQFKIN